MHTETSKCTFVAIAEEFITFMRKSWRGSRVASYASLISQIPANTDQIPWMNDSYPLLFPTLITFEIHLNEWVSQVDCCAAPRSVTDAYWTMSQVITQIRSSHANAWNIAALRCAYRYRTQFKIPKKMKTKSYRWMFECSEGWTTMSRLFTLQQTLHTCAKCAEPNVPNQMHRET